MNPTQMIVYDIPMKTSAGEHYLARLTLPVLLRQEDADRLCGIIQSLAMTPHGHLAKHYCEGCKGELAEWECELLRSRVQCKVCEGAGVRGNGAEWQTCDRCQGSGKEPAGSET
jgi:uncharacterized protein with PIN domain